MYYIMAETLLNDAPETALAYYNEVREHRGLQPLQTLTLQQITEEYRKEYIGEGQFFFHFKRREMSLTSHDGTIVHTASEYVVPIPDIEKENRY